VNDLLLLLILVIAGVLGTSAVRQFRAGHRAARHHHRALDTLGTITSGRAQAAHHELNGHGAEELPAESAEGRVAGVTQAGAPTAAATGHAPVAEANRQEVGDHHVPAHVRVVAADTPLASQGLQVVRSSRRFPPVPDESGPGDAVRVRPPSGHESSHERRDDTAEMVAVDPAIAPPKPSRRLAPPPALGNVSPPPAGPLGGAHPAASGNGSAPSPSRPSAASRGRAGALTRRVDPSPTPPSPTRSSSPGDAPTEVVRVIDDAVLSAQPAASAAPAPESVTGPPAQRALRSSRPVFSAPKRASRQVLAASSGIGRRRVLIGAGVAGVVVILAIAGVLVSQRGGGSAHSHGSSSKVAVSPAATVAPPKSPAATAPPTTAPQSTTTTAPLAPLTADAFSATYLVGTSPINVSVSGSAQSWVQIRSGGPTGPVTFQGVMTPGQSQNVTAPAWVRIGDPASTVITADGRPVGLPNPGSQQALTVTFQ
jgi:hypothetical protein